MDTLPISAGGHRGLVRSNPKLVPKGPRTREKYLQIYSEYILGGKTQQALAEKYGFKDRSHIAHIIQWATFHHADGGTGPDTETWKQVAVDKAERQIARLEEMITSHADVKLQIRILGELRRYIVMKAKLDGALQDVGAGNGAVAPQVNIFIPNLNRGEGVARAVVTGG